MTNKIVIGFFIFFLFTATLAVSIIFFINNSVTDDPAFMTAIEHIKKDDVVINHVGKIKSYGFGISSKIITYKDGSGKGSALFKIPLVGEKKDGMVEIELVQDTLNNWRVKSLIMR